MQNCNFHRDGTHVSLGSEQRSAIIFGNQMKGEVRITNESQGDVQIGFNAAN